MNRTRTTCPYCGVGCGVVVEQDSTGQVSIKGDAEHPANWGHLCSKGTALAETLQHPQRLLYPEVAGQRVSWDVATQTVAQRFQRVIQQYGADAVAFYVSGQLLTEDYYVANKLMKGFIGSANIDTNSRLCMASAVVAHKRAFGEDLVPCEYQDLEQAELIVLVGSNTAWCHPVLFQRIVKAKQGNPQLRVVVIDPRRTQTVQSADMHLAIKAGSDAFLFNGLLVYLHEQGYCVDTFVQKHTTGMQAALHAAQAHFDSYEALAARCGLSSAQLLEFFALFAATEKVVTVFSQGINQSSSGVDKGNALINCHLLTGRIGRSGMGPFSLTGQPNAMGGREVGGLANQLAAHMSLDNAVERDLVQTFWQSPTIAQREGLKAVDLFAAIQRGQVKAVWIMGTNPAVSMPDTQQVKAALSACECVVVSDCVANTDTLAFADIRLPALTWGERDGTVTNSERVISRQRAFLHVVGEAQADWEIISQVAQHMGYGKAFAYHSSAQIFAEHAALSAFQNTGGRCFDIGGLAGLSTQAFDDLVPTQWPLSQQFGTVGQSKPRLFADGKFFTPDTKARFIAITPRLPVAELGTDYPLRLNTGRLRDHWHTLTRTGISSRLSAHTQQAYIALHPQDAKQRGIQQGDIVRVWNTLGELRLRANVTEDQALGDVFIAMHWSEHFSQAACVGTLIAAVTDPLSGQPESKHAAVQVAAYASCWHGLLLSRRKLKLEAEELVYWHCYKLNDIWAYSLAGNQDLALWEQFARHLLCAKAPDDQYLSWSEYWDAAQSSYRAARFWQQQLESCLFIAAQPQQLPDARQISTLFSQGVLTSQERKGVLAGQYGKDIAPASKTVCVCFNVTEGHICEAIEQQRCSNVAELGKCLQAGTNCGSCIPELKQLLAGSVAS